MWPGFDFGPVSYVGIVCCWFSSRSEGSPGSPDFLPPQKPTLDQDRELGWKPAQADVAVYLIWFIEVQVPKEEMQMAALTSKWCWLYSGGGCKIETQQDALRDARNSSRGHLLNGLYVTAVTYQFCAKKSTIWSEVKSSCSTATWSAVELLGWKKKRNER